MSIRVLFFQICITSIYPEDEDINLSISHAFDSIGFKEKPRYEIKAIEEEDWIKRSQVSLICLICSFYFSLYALLFF